MKVLALDFDGVIADSQYECLFVGFNAYLRLNKNTKLFGGKKFTFNNFNNIKKKYKNTIKKYENLRPYVIGAFSWYVILYIMDFSIRIKHQYQFNNVREKLIKNFDEYVNYFYNERSKLQEKNYKKWLKLEAPFKKIIEGIKKLEKGYIITIATNNNRKSIYGLFKKYKIKPKIIADSNISLNKKKQLECIKNKLKVNFNEIHFVDDQVKHFPRLLKLGVNCYLATWGYNNKRQRQEAKKLWVVMLREDNFYEKLASFL